MASDMAKWDSDNTLYLFTSLTAGSSHIVTATSRIETILKANRIPFTYIDTATNESAKKLYQRRGQGKKFPLLVKEGYFLGGITEVEEWNEFGELHDEIGDVDEPETSIVTPALKQGFKSPYPLNAEPKKAEGTASSSASIASSRKTKEDDTPRISLEAAQAFGRAGSEAASIAASKKSAPSIKSNLSTHSTLPDKTIDALDALSPRPSVDSAMPAPLGLANKTSPTTGQPPAGSTEHKSHRGSSLSEGTDDAIKALEEALAIPEEKEADVSSLSIRDEAIMSTEDLSAKEGITKVDSSSASTAVVDDKSSVVAPSTAPTEKDDNEAAPPVPTKDSDPSEPEATTPTLEPRDTNTPKASMDVSREKGLDATSFNNNDNLEGDNDKEGKDTEKKGKETTATTTGEQQATTTVAGDESATAPASSSASS
ncbi:Amino acid/polyamine transporter I [Neofusicoccum parvum]|uniref:Amino acid/polyamine transporter I n=1 Tax=Neofusicoccum parvum TaxID=310453 RepID=A0ACB5S2I1_9PEZI|nr:Amino acid/polyamine transporter I [Neofusicoccum parvum]